MTLEDGQARCVARPHEAVHQDEIIQNPAGTEILGGKRLAPRGAIR